MENVLYIAIQLLIAVKTAYFEWLKIKGKSDEEINKIWAAKWEVWSLQDPTLLPVANRTTKK